MNDDSLAILGWSDGRLLVGHGPFDRQTEPPAAGAAFYLNDFGLAAAAPWHVPARWEWIEPSPVALARFGQGGLRVRWSAPDASAFAGVFEEITQAIRRGIFEKTVPVVAERGRLDQGEGRTLLGRAAAAQSPMVAYGFADGSRGFAGRSPEHLLVVEDGWLRTMALAGTARADEREVLAVDAKEIREHEFVAQALVSKLGDLGQLRRGEREIMDLGSIVHFHTPIEVKLAAAEPIAALLKRLHPTPALGPLPRTAQTLAQLGAWRERLGAPAEFGAPFGAVVDGVFCFLVAIRGVWWHQREILLAAGCGVIEPSRLVNEWRELRLKREAVKDALDLH